MAAGTEEYLDVLTREGEHTGISKPRLFPPYRLVSLSFSGLVVYISLVHRDGDYHRAVHVWIYAESTGELLLQKRADNKDSWPGLWDISCAGHISAGDTSLSSARRELEEELGVSLPFEAFELLFVYLQECVINDGTFINNEFNDVYLVTVPDHIPVDLFSLQESEVSMVKYISLTEYEDALRENKVEYVPYEVDGAYNKLFSVIKSRYGADPIKRHESIQKQIKRYASVELKAELSTLSNGDYKALEPIIQASKILDNLFLEQDEQIKHSCATRIHNPLQVNHAEASSDWR
ncbi:hypothetical protein KP509_02G060800 [Ceratopteris richardii]|uniref:Nudix hydrolase domain-containing protein n=1 Tax=Ceratopteris richardii TaxID=49495 RepID=A0A8T2VHT5_CERRI|nr:hypothetical protein KP509_02G060800 [Ceratopteris richardii]